MIVTAVLLGMFAGPDCLDEFASCIAPDWAAWNVCFQACSDERVSAMRSCRDDLGVCRMAEDRRRLRLCMTGPAGGTFEVCQMSRSFLWPVCDSIDGIPQYCDRYDLDKDDDVDLRDRAGLQVRRSIEW